MSEMFELFLVRYWNWRHRDYERRQDHPLHGPMRDEVFNSKEGAIARIRELALEKFGEDIVEEDGKGWIIRESEKAFRDRASTNRYCRRIYRSHRWWYRVDRA